MQKHFRILLSTLILLAISGCNNTKGNVENKPIHFSPAEDVEPTHTDNLDDEESHLFPNCNNGQVDTMDGEECDGQDLNGMNCFLLDEGYAAGVLSCNEFCHFDTTRCTFATDQCIGQPYPESYHLDLNQPCNFDSDCDNKYCATYKLDPNDLSKEAHYCGVSDKHYGEEIPNIRNLHDNLPCNFDSECASGYCWKGPGINICASVCTEDTIDTPSSGFICKKDTNSPTGLSCQPNSNKGEGSPCNIAAFDCAENLYCILGFCTPSCNSDQDCKSTMCIEEEGHPSVCLVDYLWLRVPVGGQCYSNFHCESELCELGYCVAKDVPECRGPRTYPIYNVVRDGYPCNLDTDCISGYCNSKNYCGDISGARVTNPKMKIHYPCEEDQDCDDGLLCINYSPNFSICGQQCLSPNATTNGYYNCVEIIHGGSLYGCKRNNDFRGFIGDTCLAGDFDCSPKNSCIEGYCL